MQVLDWTVLIAYFVAMLGVGLWARTKIKDASDFFTAGGNMPWWLSGISHHMSGYSSAVFVGYAALAYSFGFSLYVWWALSIAIALFIGARIFAPRWVSLRVKFDVISPLEYLAIRYNVPAQQVLAWSGTFLKIFDVGAKWASAAILLNAFAGVPFVFGILLVGPTP
jgi:solute:Na+ symporter, SSS family